MSHCRSRRKRPLPQNATLIRSLLEFERATALTVQEYVCSPDGERNHVAAERAPRALRQAHQAFRVASDRALQLAFGVPMLKIGHAESPVPALAVLAPKAGPISAHEGATLGFRVYALVAIAELERFLRSVARWWLTPTNLAAARTRAKPKTARIPELAAEPATARSQLVGLLAPTSGSPSAFAARLRFVFGVRPPPGVATALQTLVQWRHEFSHRNNPAHAIDWTNGPDLEVLLSWHIALLALSDQLAASLSSRR